MRGRADCIWQAEGEPASKDYPKAAVSRVQGWDVLGWAQKAQTNRTPTDWLPIEGMQADLKPDVENTMSGAPMSSDTGAW